MSSPVSRSDDRRPPATAIAEHGIEDDQEAAGAGNQRYLLGLAGLDKPSSVEGAQDWIAARGREGGHVQRRAHGPAAAPDRTFALGPTAVAVERSDADQRGDGAVIQPAQLRQQGQEG